MERVITGKALMTTDDMLMWHYYQRPKTLNRYLVPGWIACILAFITPIFHSRYLIGLLLLTCIFAVVRLVQLGFILWKQFDYDRSRLRRSEQMPFDKIQLAQQLEPDYETAMLWVIECEESHIGGECPLCGAV